MKNRKLLCCLLCLIMMFSQLFVPVTYAVQDFSDSSQENSTTEAIIEQNVTENGDGDSQKEPGVPGSGNEYFQTDQSVSNPDIDPNNDPHIDTDIDTLNNNQMKNSSELQTVEEVYKTEPPIDEEDYKIWKQNLAAQMNLQPRLIEVMSVSGNRIYNDFLECAVGSDGKFTMGTTGGNPENSRDNNKRMLFGHPNPWSSYTTVRIDGTSYIYKASSQPVFDSENNTCISQYTVGDFTVKQVLSIVKNNATQREDTVQVKYIVTNNSSSSHNLGVRIMFDTMLGNNDSAPFRIPGIGAVTKELELAGDNIPEYWQAFDSLTNPSVISQGTLLSMSDNKPDKVQFTNWNRVYNKSWGYTVNPASNNGDSAVSIIWEPKTIGAGETQEYITNYGLSEFTQDLRPPLAVSLTGAGSVEVMDNSYVPNPFTVTAYIMNNGNTVANNVKVKILLPEGLSVVGGQNETNLGDIAPAKETQVSCRVFIDNPSEQERNLTYSLIVSADNADSKTVSRSIKIPPLKGSDQMKYKAGLEGLENGTTWFVQDPVNAATGNFVKSNTDITIDGYNPLSFIRFYNTMDNWQGALGLNWHHNYEFKLVKAGNKVKVTFDDGHLEDFILNEDGTYTAMPGKYGELENHENGGYKLTRKDKTTYYFSPEGNLTVIEDIKGNRTELIYNDEKLLKIQNACGFLQFEYTGNFISAITDSVGRSVQYGYTDEKLTGVKNVEGNTYTYEYDSNGRLIKLIDPLNNVTITNVYDDKGRTTEQTMADGVTNRLSYDDTNLTTTLTQSGGSQIIYKYDKDYRIYERLYINGSEKLTFNDNNQITSFTDKNGNTYHYEYDLNGNITKETNPLGLVTEYVYDENNMLTSLKNPDGSIYSYQYDSKGNMISAADPLGRITKMEYNEKGLPVQVTLSDGTYSTVEYDVKGNIIAITDPLGNQINNEYDNLNRVISITKPEGNKIEFQYTPSGKIKKVINPDGTNVTSSYDARGLLTEETDESCRTTKYQYNGMGKLIAKIDAAGGITKYEYDGMWNLCKITRPDGSTIKYGYNAANQLEAVTDPANNITSYQYDANGNMLKETDPNGNSNKYAYDALNRLIQATNANNAVTKYEYRYDGKLQKVIDALNGTTEYSYDAAGQLTSVRDALGAITAYEYNSLGFITSVTDARGAVTKYEYNPTGRVTQIIKADGTAESIDYDQNGNLIKYTDAKGNAATYTYDSVDRLTSIKDAVGGVKTIGYTATGKVASLTDENGNKTIYEYDELDRLTAVTDAKEAKTTYVYDAIGNLTEVHQYAGVTQETIAAMKFPKGKASSYQTGLTEQVTKYKYDNRGLLIEEINPANKVTVYTYDANGNLVSKTDEEGYITKYEYDPVNNLNKITYNDGKQVEYKYNPLGQVIGMKDWLGETAYDLDVLGRLLKVKDYENKITEYTWSSTGQKQTIQYPDSSFVNYEYDLLGRLTKVEDAQKKATTYQYDKTGNVTQKLLPNGVKTTYQYDALSRLTCLSNYSKNGKITDDYKYTYDAAGNKIKVQRNKFNNELSVIFDETEGLTNYKYDQLNQLTEVAKPNKTTEKYFYDTVGNRVRKENWVCSAFINAGDYKYDIQNRLTDINIQGPQIPCKDLINQTIQMEYDERGNLTKTTSGNSVLSQYTFDAANRLSEATNVLGIKTNFVYDGEGRRTKMRIDLPKPNIHNIFKPGLSSLFNSKNQANEKDTCSWLYNGKDYKLEYNYALDITEPYENVLMIYGEGIDTQRYTYGLEVLSLDTWNKSVSPWFQNCDKEITSQKVDRGYYLQDELGSPVRIVGEAGNTKAIYSYDAFGRPIIPVNLISNCKTRGNIYSYTGYQYDLPTGLMYAQARYYMPEVGRFISEDAYKGNVAEPGSLNLYAYCGNNHVNYVDPSGHMEIEDKYILNAEDYAIMHALTHLYGMYEAEGNTTLKESIRAKAVSIRQQAKYSGKYSLSNKQGTYLDNYQYKSKYHHDASKYIDAEYITKERIWIYGGKAQTWPQKGYEGLIILYTNIGVLKARSIPRFIKELVVPDDPIDILDSAGKISFISDKFNYVGKNVQEGNVRIRVGDCYQGTTYWFNENKLWHQESYDNSLYLY